MAGEPIGRLQDRQFGKSRWQIDLAPGAGYNLRNLLTD
jgi:hypothetical protein